VPEPDWLSFFPGAITVSDAAGIVIAMNERAAETFATDGGRDLIGKNMLDCHPEPSASLVRELLANPRVNAYTIEKRGVKKLIYQAPWYRDGAFAGFVELSLVLPAELPHFIRQP
jgi:transcriptional regulator with PAS, ATPase and Fis domain